jgi:hypothetical protein
MTHLPDSLFLVMGQSIRKWLATYNKNEESWLFSGRVAKFFFVQNTKKGKIPNDHGINQVALKCSKGP